VIGPERDHQSASGPHSTPTASTAKPASQPVGLDAPPAASSAAPTSQPAKADRPKPTVECSAIVAPRKPGSAHAAIPEVSEPESAGTVTA